MSREITLDDAATSLAGLVGSLKPGDEVVLTDGRRPVAKLVPIVEGEPPKSWLRPPPGLGKGMITIVSDDDEHLKDFAEYMP